MSDSTITRIAEQNAGKIALIKENREVLNAVRRLKTGDKSALAEAAGVSWPKLNKDIGDLEKENAVQMGARDSGQIYEVNSNFAFFVGLSITNDSIKLSICDFSLQPLTRDDLSARGFSHLHQMLPFSETGENNHVVSFGVTTELRAIIGKVNEIIGILLAEESANFHLLGITIAFAGFIDYKSRVFAFSPHVQKLNETPLDDLVLPAVKESLDNRNIFLYYENDSESAVLYEKESLFFSEDKDRRDLRNKENIGCIYISAGIGLGLILNNELFRGSTNTAGEIGHIRAPDFFQKLVPKTDAEKRDKESYFLEDNEESREDNKKPPSCKCGHDDCLETKLKLDVFNADTFYDFINKTTADKLDVFAQTHPFRYRVLEEYISYVFNLLINLFNLDIIIFSGRIIKIIHAMGENLELLKRTSALKIPSNACKCFAGNNEKAVLVGAAIAAYYKCGFGDSEDPIKVKWRKA